MIGYYDSTPGLRSLELRHWQQRDRDVHLLTTIAVAKILAEYAFEQRALEFRRVAAAGCLLLENLRCVYGRSSTDGNSLRMAGVGGELHIETRG